MKELLDNHPLTAKLIREHYTKSWLSSIEKAGHLPDDFLEFAKSFELDNDKIALVLQPRGLLDFFDVHGVHIWTKWTEKGWQMYIGKGTDVKKFDDRAGCEKYAVTKAFEMLEKILNDDDYARISSSDTSDSGE